MLNAFFPLFIHSAVISALHRPAQHPPPTPTCHLLYLRCLTISNQTFRSEFLLMKSSIFVPHHFPRGSLQKLPICHATSVCLFNNFQLQSWFSNSESNAQTLPPAESSMFKRIINPEAVLWRSFGDSAGWKNHILACTLKVCWHVETYDRLPAAACLLKISLQMELYWRLTLLPRNH